MTAVLGTVLMLALMATLVPGAILLRAAVSDEMHAQREAAERAAYCARNADVGPPTCEESGPLPGYECAQTDVDVWVCSRVQQKPEAPTVSTPPPTMSPTPTIPLP